VLAYSKGLRTACGLMSLKRKDVWETSNKSETLLSLSETTGYCSANCTAAGRNVGA
jgi:hypothetical protein